MRTMREGDEEAKVEPYFNQELVKSFTRNRYDERRLFIISQISIL